MYELLHQCASDQEVMQARVDKLIELDEKRREAFDKTIIEQERIKGTFNKNTWNYVFNIGDVVLLWDKNTEKPGNHGKLEKIWMGLFRIARLVGKGSFWLESLDGEELELSVNGRLLKHYFPPMN